jgi:hypothetical protein
MKRNAHSNSSVTIQSGPFAGSVLQCKKSQKSAMVLLSRLEAKRVGDHLGSVLGNAYQLGFDLIETKREEEV